MDLDKISALVTKLGFPASIGIWLAYEIHRFISGLLENQAAFLATNQQIVLLLQKLIDMHNR